MYILCVIYTIYIWAETRWHYSSTFMCMMM